jgi:hypothetical protein
MRFEFMGWTGTELPFSDMKRVLPPCLRTGVKKKWDPISSNPISEKRFFIYEAALSAPRVPVLRSSNEARILTVSASPPGGIAVLEVPSVSANADPQSHIITAGVQAVWLKATFS